MKASAIMAIHALASFGVAAFPFTISSTTATLLTSRLRRSQPRRTFQQFLSSTTSDDKSLGQSTVSESPAAVVAAEAEEVSLYRDQGLCCVYKPRDWTSNDVVSYIRKMLERDATLRGAKPSKVGSRKNKSRIVRVGHGGTLDPLATGVLVVGVGSGTKKLQTFLDGSKRYKAGAELGFETTTLDMEGNVTKREPFEHITADQITQVLPSFIGTIEQIPPIYSAIRKDGKRLYEQARKGVSAEDVDIPARQVLIHGIDLISCNIPRFELEIECGGGTYIRSLVRDIAYKLGSAGTTTSLERTKQGQFTMDDAIAKDDWSADNIYAAISRFNSKETGGSA